MKTTGILSLLLLTFCMSNGFSQENEGEMMANFTEALDLSDTQVGPVMGLFTGFRSNLDNILLKYEGLDEPDVGAMISEIRDERDKLNTELQAVLSKNQFDIYQSKLDGIFTDMFNDLAEIRLMDVQPVIDLTDKQVEDLIPIIGKSMLQTVRLMFENAGTKLTLPKKINLSKQIKAIEKEKRTAMENILTPAQMAAYDQFKEEQKAARKNK